jgi:hypothetical protein
MPNIKTFSPFAIIGISALILVGCSPKPAATIPESATQSAQTDVTTSSSPQPQSLRSLLAMGSAQQCTYTDTTSHSSGTYFVDAGKVRGDTSTTIGDKTTMMHVITDGQTMHMWIDGQPQGFTYTVTATPESSSSPDSISTNKVNVDQMFDYQCQPWTVDASKFELPSGVTFKDFSAMMTPPLGAKEAPVDTQNMKAIQCSACDNLEGSAKTQCQQTLSCP